VLGDLDGDGRPELILVDRMARLLIAAFAEDGGITVSAPLTILRNISSVTTGDLDGDGRLDIIVGGLAEGPDGPIDEDLRRLVVLAQTQPGAFEPVAHALPRRMSSPVPFDFDGDGDLDLLTSSDEEIYVLSNDP
jgi:hypothetical protein